MMLCEISEIRGIDWGILYPTKHRVLQDLLMVMKRAAGTSDCLRWLWNYATHLLHIRLSRRDYIASRR
ncbi:hypothetical protein NEOLEDRAFT_1140205 [Neolentinus lepideus HHB14362 ss-1]|uniref:Uncharacterized protein n=1 Tax=Neolentinus lepideus HHB14362 ss-1 TaxID=1314782 RepID=A0A165PDE4_9AGAM|nr:hypothetical protein NEOLEDRAFT_1140205 [Neolentinus lepideus HHB14362 ss-1]